MRIGNQARQHEGFKHVPSVNGAKSTSRRDGLLLHHAHTQQALRPARCFKWRAPQEVARFGGLTVNPRGRIVLETEINVLIDAKAWVSTDR